MSEPLLGSILTSESVANAHCYASVTLHGHEYHVGDCAYINPDGFAFNVKLPVPAKKPKQDHSESKQVLFVLLVILNGLIYFMFCSCCISAVFSSVHMSDIYELVYKLCSIGGG